MALALFYNLEFFFENDATGTTESFKMFNLSGKRLKEVREGVFRSGLFFGAIPENKEDLKFPKHVASIIPPHKIKYILVSLVVGTDGKENTEKRES